MMRLINIAGLIYNHCIALHKRYYRLYGKYIHKYTLQKHITKLKRTKRFGYFWSRNIEGRVKTVTVKHDLLGDIYIYLVCDSQCDTVRPRTGEIVGLDFGLKKFLTASNGNDIVSADFFRLNAKIIRTKCRKLSPKKKGSGNFQQARLELARAYRKINNQRRDFHFKTARKLCNDYALICLEELNIKGMAKRWGREIHSLGFSDFVRILQYEAMKLGTRIIFVDRFYPSSQLCNVCGYRNKEVKNLKILEWDCPSCGTHHDRDRNAA